MITPESRSEKREMDLAGEVFKPGNLVHGFRTVDFPKILKDGFTVDLCEKRGSFCTAVLSNLPLPGRYKAAYHHGPLLEITDAYPQNVFYAAAIISKEKLQALFPNQFFAIGRFFQEANRSLCNEKFDFNEKENTVFGIPIIPSAPGELSYADEARLYLNNGEEKITLPLDILVGLAIPSGCLNYFKGTIKRKNLSHLPVFSPDIQLLTHL